MRLALALLAVFVAVTPALAQEQPRTGGVLKVAMIGEPPSLDLHTTTAVITQQINSGTPIRWVTTKEYDYMYKHALVAKQQLEGVGFKIDLQVVDWATLVQRRNKPELFDIFSTAITFNPEPGLNTGVQCNWPGWWCLEDKEKWLDSVQREADPRKRKVMWEKVQQLFYEDVGRIKFGDWFGFQVHGKNLRGVHHTNEQAFFNVWFAK